jgi:hypothetical protein
MWSSLFQHLKKTACILLLVVFCPIWIPILAFASIDFCVYIAISNRNKLDAEDSDDSSLCPDNLD